MLYFCGNGLKAVFKQLFNFPNSTDEKIDSCGAIDAVKTVEDIRSEPYSLPAGLINTQINVIQH